MVKQPSTDTPLHTRVLALSGLARIAFMVNDIARSGRCNEKDFSNMVELLFTDADDQAFFAALQQGKVLAVLKKQLHGEYQQGDAKTMMHYMMGLTAVEKKLMRHQVMLQTIGESLKKINKNKSFFGEALHENTVAALAGLYGDTLSTLKPRIIVHGKPEYLNHASNTNRVRVLLLVGIRLAYVWRSHGGNHFRLMFERNKMLRIIDAMEQETGHA